MGFIYYFGAPAKSVTSGVLFQVSKNTKIMKTGAVKVTSYHPIKSFGSGENFLSSSVFLPGFLS
jgi:hypothetical protein